MKKELPEQLQFMANKRAVQHSTTASMAGKVCVVTGSTSGVGLEAVRRLAAGGAHIVMVCRDKAKADKVREEIVAKNQVRVDIVIADFSDLEQVRAAAAALLRDYPRIDVLINSAGIHSTTRTLTKAGFESVFCVNHLASFLFTDLLLNRLKASAPARIIQINSEGHRFSDFHLDDYNWERNRYTGLKGYGSSKTAQLLTTWEFADALAGSGVTINAMHPGDVRSNIGNNNGLVYRLFKRFFITPLMLKDPAISGDALYWLAAAPEMGAVSGRFFHLTIDEKPAAHALDRAKGKQAWTLSRKLVGLGQA